MKYSKDDIVKALECCSLLGSESCDRCPLKEECLDSPLASVMAERALELINILLNDIKRLKADNEELYLEMSERMKEEVQIVKKYTAKQIRNSIKESMFNHNNKFDFIYDEIFSVIDKVLEGCNEKDS